MDNNSDSHNKKPWFGPKRSGIGTAPKTWQGWLTIIVAVIVELLVVSFAHMLHPSWFVAHSVGTGFSPATWQGWVATIGPIAVWLLVARAIYVKQNRD